MGLFDWIKHTKKESRIDLGYHTELHNHFLPAIDDGVQSADEAVRLIAQLQQLGIQRIITTPHVMADFYKNTPQIIQTKCTEIQQKLQEHGITVVFEASAEYYLDEGFVDGIAHPEKLLPFGDGYVLFETSYINESPFLTKVIFDLKSLGYKPILAHPERYHYLNYSISNYEKIFEKGVYFQLNINSLSGYYSKETQKIAEKLIDAQMIHFIGTDCHNQKHLQILQKSISVPYYEKLLQLDIMNDKIPLTSYRK